MSFKIFVGMNGSTEYVRLSDANKTTLAANITADSLTITLADASVITPLIQVVQLLYSLVTKELLLKE